MTGREVSIDDPPTDKIVGDIGIDIFHFGLGYTRVYLSFNFNFVAIKNFDLSIPVSEVNLPRHKVLIIGCGSIGERHIRCFSKTGRADVTACDTTSSSLRAMGEKYGVGTVSDWQVALASKEFGAVVICTPTPSHVPIALYALENDVHTLIEKPLSHSLDSVDKLLATSKHSTCHAAVAYIMHVYPVLSQAREFIRSGAIGPILQATVTAGQPFYKYRPAYAQSYYRDHNSGGGAIQDALTHSANWMESVVGPAESVLCDCAHQFLPDVEVEDTVHLNARHGNVLTSFTLNQFQAPTENTIQLNAGKGSVKIELHQQRWGVLEAGSSQWEWHEARVEDQDSHFVAQANAFLDLTEGQPSCLCSLESAAQSIRFNLAALASAKAGTRIFCRDIEP